MNSRKIQNLFGPHPSHLLALLSLPPSSRFRIWISGSQTLQCPLTPRLSRPPLSLSLPLSPHLSLIHSSLCPSFVSPMFSKSTSYIGFCLTFSLYLFILVWTTCLFCTSPSPFWHNSSFSQVTNTYLSHSPAFLCFLACVHSMCVFVSKCQWFSSSAFVLLAGCRVVLEVKVNVVVVSVVATSEWRLSEVPWKLVWSQFLVIPVVTTCRVLGLLPPWSHVGSCLSLFLFDLLSVRTVHSETQKFLEVEVFKGACGIFGQLWRCGALFFWASLWLVCTCTDAHIGSAVPKFQAILLIIIWCGNVATPWQRQWRRRLQAIKYQCKLLWIFADDLGYAFIVLDLKDA